MNVINKLFQVSFVKIIIGPVLICVLYIILRVKYLTTSVVSFAGLFVVDLVFFGVMLWNFWFLISGILKPLSRLIDRMHKINEKDSKFTDKKLKKQDVLDFASIMLNDLCTEFERNKSELKAYSEQMALRASMIRELRQEFEKKVFDLFTLFDVAKELNSTLNPETISQLIVLTCMGQMAVSNTVVMQLEESLDYTLRVCGYRGLSFKPDKDFKIDANSKFVRHLTSQARAMTVHELEPIFAGNHEFQKILKLKTSLIISFIDKNETKVLITLGTKVSGEMFNRDDIEFLSVLANIGGLALENAKLYSMAITDGLTKLYLQRYFLLKAEEEAKRANRYKQPMSIIMIDIDNFKRINDTYGHLEGNRVLLNVSEIIKKTTRDTDVPARYGGEEFSILMPMTDKFSAKIVAERIRQAIESHEITLQDTQVKITVSVGVASFPSDGINSNIILNCADDMLYEAKRTGKNKVCVSPAGLIDTDNTNN
ncbi:MAG: GGDEF domain-containing protein [bacterium]